MLIVSEIHVEFSCDDLPDGERNVLIHHTLGRSIADIARLCHFTEGTVKQYLNRARARLHARNNAEACWLARFTGQISDAEILLAYTAEQQL